MVRLTGKSNYRLRPALYVTLRESTRIKTRDPTESINRVPSTNGRVIGAKESMDRTVPLVGHFSTPARLDGVAQYRLGGTQ